MPRPELHSADRILDAARELVVEGGARSATIEAIVRESGAPKGSIYHRFAAVDDLLAEMWLRAVRRAQRGFLAALEQEDAVEAAVAAALASHDFARREPADARLLASMRREDVVRRIGNPTLQAALHEVNAPLGAAVAELARRLYGRASRSAVERTMCAVIDLPQGAIRRHLTSGGRVPATVRPQLEAAVRAALAASAQGRGGAARRP